jgi:nucleotide-binding universal stress UspA family protein
MEVFVLLNGREAMNAKKILFPTDFSHTGDAALAFATMLAKESQGQIIVVHAQESPLAYGGGEMYYGIPEPSTEELMTMLHEIKPADPTVPVEYRLVMGVPEEAIVRLAEEEEVDMIVLGSHGRTGITRLLLGSVAEAIVRKAHCPVLVYKQPVKQAVETRA